jgi:membrane protein implicated in regulation of membrane protease activity
MRSSVPSGGPRHHAHQAARGNLKGMSVWIVWLVAACLLGIGEMHQGGFYLAPFAIGAGLAAVVGLLGVGAFARRHRRWPPAIRTGAAALIGKPAVVIERIANGEGVGCVKIDGEVWTARSYDEDEIIDAGERVEVVEIRGATALVMH